MATCQYKEYCGQGMEQFISGCNDDGMIGEILKEVDTLEDIEDTTSVCCCGHIG